MNGSSKELPKIKVNDSKIADHVELLDNGRKILFDSVYIDKHCHGPGFPLIGISSQSKYAHPFGPNYGCSFSNNSTIYSFQRAILDTKQTEVRCRDFVKAFFGEGYTVVMQGDLFINAVDVGPLRAMKGYKARGKTNTSNKNCAT